MQETRRQHTVSKFYLKGFADDRDQISRIQLPGEPRIKLSINDATVIKDFYSLELPNGERTDMFEKLFAEIEGPASRALEAVRGGKWPLSAEEKEELGFWIALQQLRGEEIRGSQNHVQGEFIRLLVGVSGKEALRSHIGHAEGRTISNAELDLEWQDLTKPGGPDLAANPAEHVRLVVEVAPGFAAYLRDSHWMLHVFERKALLTADHPVTMDERNRGPHDGIGLFTADMFALPLSRRLALTIQPRHSLRDFTPNPEQAPDFKIPGTAASANSFNQQTVREARRYVYLHPDDTLSAYIHMPEPVERSRMRASNIDNLISEDGLFPKGGPPAPRPSAKGEGTSLSDLPWPIPGRIPPTANRND